MIDPLSIAAGRSSSDEVEILVFGALHYLCLLSVEVCISIGATYFLAKFDSIKSFASAPRRQENFCLQCRVSALASVHCQSMARAVLKTLLGAGELQQPY